MKTIKVQVYNFNELPIDVQKDVIEKHYEKEDYPFLTRDIHEQLNSIDSFFYNSELYYSLSYSQGDGLSFSADFDLNKWINEKYNFKQSVKDALKTVICSIDSNGNKGYYCYASTSNIDADIDPIVSKYPNIEKLVNLIIDNVERYYMDLCVKLEAYGYSILDYRMDEDEYSDYADVNEYQYLLDGTL
ncbi:MAG TPA: hypothetical protein GX695_02175, partial [Acholeplasmataceae bacterium]|nr:hypothetical protein [Acholeplasmataceae bacterium]